MSKTAPETVEAGTVLAGRYRVVRPLGKGGMGAVYLVQHLHTDQQLALKVLHATVVTNEIALTRFRREARAPARVNSDHVVQVTDADVAPELGGVPFLVMEWLRGQDLEELAAARTALPAAEVVLYLRQAARALDKAHALGIIHRDLKPENIFLTKRDDGTPCVKILDFGIAKLNDTGDEAGHLKATGTGQIFGTPLYMSPEQTKAELHKVSPQTDIWALGIIAHRLLTGTEPWDAPTLTALIAQIAFQPLPVPSEHGHAVGPGFDAWFARCCAREPQDRFPTAGEAVTELARAVGVAEEGAPTSLSLAPPQAIIRPPREDSARTAFSATAPAPSAITADPIAATAPPRSPSSIQRMLLGVGISVIFGVAAIVGYASSRPPTTAAIAPPEATTAPAVVPTATPVTIVTPSTAAPVETAPPAPSASAVLPEPKRSTPPVRVAPEPPTTAHRAPLPPPPPPPPPPPATAPPPPPPSDPLGTRH